MGLKTEDWVGIMGSIGTIMEQKRKERMDYLNQPLVKIWNEDTGQEEYVRKNDAVGMPTENPNAAADDFDSNMQGLQILYPDAFTPEVLDKWSKIKPTIQDANDVAQATTYFTNLTKTADPAFDNTQFFQIYKSNKDKIFKLKTDDATNDKSVTSVKTMLTDLYRNQNPDMDDKDIKNMVNEQMDKYTKAGGGHFGSSKTAQLVTVFGWNPAQDWIDSENSKDGQTHQGTSFKTAMQAYENYMNYHQNYLNTVSASGLASPPVPTKPVFSFQNPQSNQKTK